MVSGDRNRSPAPEAVKAAPVSADELCIRTWLHNRGENTRRAYERDVRDCRYPRGQGISRRHPEGSEDGVVTRGAGMRREGYPPPRGLGSFLAPLKRGDCASPFVP